MAVATAATFISAVWFAGGGRPVAPSADIAGYPATTPVASPSDHRVIGAVGCAGASCHGGHVADSFPRSAWGTDSHDGDRWRSSFTVWRSYDPHARAFATLESDRSQAIELALSGPCGSAAKDARCLACHATPALANKTDDHSKSLHKDGVGCEACHGPADRWVDAHLGWTETTDRGKAYDAHDMTKLFDTAVRAETCAGCHVGAPADAHTNTPTRDVNHDLIAAGHPRLVFDYATYVRALPPHWAEKDRSVRPAKFRPESDVANHWRVGRAATAVAAFALLEDRATRGKSHTAPWPELAEADCYSCHHGMAPDDWRSRPPTRSHGAIRWNDPPLLTALAAMSGKPPAARAPIDRLKILMGMPRPDPDAVAAQASEAAGVWRGIAAAWSAEKPAGPDAIAECVSVANHIRWDEACQAYYALLAIDRARRPGPLAPTAADSRLAALRLSLLLPRGGGDATFNSPFDRDPTRKPDPFRELFRANPRPQPRSSVGP